MHEETKDEAPLPREHIKSERSANLPPCLHLGGDDRRFGVGTKSEHQPETKKGQKMELDTDSLTTEKEEKKNLQRQRGNNAMGRNKRAGSE